MRFPKLLTLLSVLCLTTVVYGQSTFGTIVGTVKDAAGSVMVGAKITVTNEGTNIAQRGATNGLGN